ncbi:MAG: hypothetical protein HZB46_03375 [Solirubrobacterales bacterium]|nr:hypothetical protein [Solirubrobacterales bacterium]
MTIQHVSLETRPADVEAELAFWAVLGFEPVEPPGSLGERSAWMQRGATQVHLLFEDEPVVPPEYHVAVVVDDYDAVTRALDVEPRTQHWGAPRGFVRSPGGHRVEVMAAPPA